MKSNSLRNAGIASVASMAFFAGCSSEQKSYEKWMETPGAANRINLDAVQKALEKSKSIDDFEKTVNEIYEGPHLVLIEVKEDGNGKKRISGYEDVNNNKMLNPESDFLLFSSSVGDGAYELRGAGAHSYYHYTGHYHGGSSLMLGYIIGSMMTRPYYTTAGADLYTHRNNYRATPQYNNQQRQNMAFRKAQMAKNPSAAKGFRSRVSSTSSYKSSRGSGFRSGS
ncbi:MAG: hypothetical protein JW915_11070 [Chitinispirillaceae bacterium]|nr:hypothetical protein [Chitinispirillaceae bacterium]